MIDIADIFESYPHLLDDANRLVKQKVRYPKSENVLYARQKEFVVSFKGDRFAAAPQPDVVVTADSPPPPPLLQKTPPVLYVGTEDVLTCHVIVLHHAFTNVTALAHFDEYVRERGLNRFIDAFKAKVFKRFFVEDWEEEEWGDEDQDDEEYEWEEWEESEEEEDEESGGKSTGKSFGEPSFKMELNVISNSSSFNSQLVDGFIHFLMPIASNSIVFRY